MQIRIKQHQFELSEPFQAGHPLTSAEAQALNSLRAENIRNNAAKELARLVQGDKPLTGPTLAQFKAWLEEYDLSYRFYLRRERFSRSEPQPAPFDLALRRIALREAKIMANRQGRDLAEPELEAAIQALMGLPELQAEARNMVETEQEVAASALEQVLASS